MRRLVRWIDDNLVWLGVLFLCVGLALVALDAVRQAYGVSAVAGTGSGTTLSAPALALLALSALSQALVYNSVWMIAIGVLLKHWRVTLVGFEDAVSSDIRVDGPDDNNIVWVGRTYTSDLDARLAFEALSKRIRPTP